MHPQAQRWQDNVALNRTTFNSSANCRVHAGGDRCWAAALWPFRLIPIPFSRAIPADSCRVFQRAIPADSCPFFQGHRSRLPSLFSSPLPMTLRHRLCAPQEQRAAAAWSQERNPAGSQLLIPAGAGGEVCVHRDDELAAGDRAEKHMILSAFSKFQLQARRGYTYLH